jgi:hypothetical protein
MKKKNLLLTAVATIGLAAATIAQTVPNYLPTNGLVGWYPFNGNANDESGLGTNGVINSALLSNDRFGNNNEAFYFNGTTSNIDLGINPSINSILNDFSLSYWIKSEVNGGTIFANYSSQGGSSWRIAAKINSNGTIGTGYLINPNWQSTNSSPYTITLNQWFHYTFTRSGGSTNIYINGILISNNSLSTAQLNNPTFPAATTKIGFNFPSSGGSDYFKGILDDIGIWNRALTQEEITALYTNCDLNASITPATVFVNAGANAQFTASSADPTATYQWQSNADNFGWLNVPTNNFYSGATTNSLTVNNVQLGNHNQPFRVIATAGNCVDTSATAFIQIADTCVNTVIDTNYVTVTDTNHVTIYDTVTTYISITDTLFIDINTVGLNNNTIVNTIKVFPNPSNSILNLNYGNYATLNNYRVKITNALGQTIYDQAITQPSETLDLSTFGGNGIYYLNIINPQGNVIETRKIVLQ